MTNRIQILSVPIDALTFDQTITIIKEHLHNDKQLFIATPNPEMLLETLHNDTFQKVLNSTNLNIPDGIGLLWASTYLNSVKNNKSRVIKSIKAIYFLLCVFLNPAINKNILPQRVTGSDLMQKLCQSIKNDFSIFLLGAKPGIADATAEILQKKYNNNIVGTDSGKSDRSDTDRIIKKINHSQAEVLFVAFGAPTQELWIHQNLNKLKHIKLAIGVGGAFDFISGEIKRAPHSMQKMGMEWLYRLFKQPSRFKRIYNATIVFPYKVISSSF